MSVKTRELVFQVYYVFNGNDFIVNKNIDERDYRKILKNCNEHDICCSVKEKSPVSVKKNIAGCGSCITKK
ncbi:MAG: hypothetical protein ACOY30_15265 [Bacillota bacterium]